MPHCSLRLCPSYECTSGQTHGHMSLGANPPLLSVLETHLLTWPRERALGSIGKIPCRSKWQPNPILFFWKIPWTEEPGGLYPKRSPKFQTYLATKQPQQLETGGKHKSKNCDDIGPFICAVISLYYNSYYWSYSIYVMQDWLYFINIKLHNHMWGLLLVIDPMDCSTPGFPVLHYLLEFAQTHVHRVGDNIQQFHPLSPLLLLPSIFPSIRVFYNESALRIGWPKY